MEWGAIVSALLPVLVGGGLTQRLSPFLEAREKFRKRVDVLQASLRERLAGMHTDLLNRVVAVALTDDVLRGDDLNQPDLVGRHTRETFRLFKIFHRLEVALRVIGVVDAFLFGSAIVGVVLLLLSVLVPQGASVIVIVALSVLLLQITAAILAYAASRRIDGYEDTTH